LEDLSKFFCTHLGYIHTTTATNPSTKTKTKLSLNKYVCPSHIPVGEAWQKKTLRGASRSLEKCLFYFEDFFEDYIFCMLKYLSFCKFF
jgi:hypothetical protein